MGLPVTAASGGGRRMNRPCSRMADQPSLRHQPPALPRAVTAPLRSWPRVILLTGLTMLLLPATALARDELILPSDGIFDAAGNLTYPERSRLSRQMRTLEEGFNIKVTVAFLGYLPAAQFETAATDLARRMLPDDRPGLLAVHSQVTDRVSWHVRPTPWTAFISPGRWQQVQDELAEAPAPADRETPAEHMLRALALMAAVLPTGRDARPLDRSALALEMTPPEDAGADRTGAAEGTDLRALWLTWWLPATAGLTVLLIVGATFLVARAWPAKPQGAAGEPAVAAGLVPLRFPEVTVGERLGAPFGGGAIGLAGQAPRRGPESSDSSSSPASRSPSEPPARSGGSSRAKRSRSRSPSRGTASSRSR